MYRDDRDALLARVDALERELATSRGKLAAAEARRDELEAELCKALATLQQLAPATRRRRLRVIQLAAMALGVGFALGAVIAVPYCAVARETPAPAPRTELVPVRESVAPSPPSPPSPSLPSAPAVAATPSSPPAHLLPAYLTVAEVYARIVEAIEDSYPGVPADRTRRAEWRAHMPVFKFYIDPWTSIAQIRALAAARGEPLDAAVVAYLDHLKAGYPRIEQLQLYVRRQDYVDDGWARLAAEDPALRAWFAEHRRLVGVIRGHLTAAWTASVGDGAAAAQPQIAVWEACSPILPLVVAADPATDEALRAHVDACRASAGALRGTNAAQAVDNLCDGANHYRRQPAGDRAGLRTAAVSYAVFAHTALLHEWIGSDEILPPPHDDTY